jgi:hypothetical protein
MEKARYWEFNSEPLSQVEFLHPAAGNT